jgi:uncharacterized membrane protein YfcA
MDFASSYDIILALLIASIAIGAYRRARKQGTWSWRNFGKAMLGAAIICAVGISFVIFLSRRLGPSRVGLATFLTVIVILIGVALLALWLRPRKPRQN